MNAAGRVERAAWDAAAPAALATHMRASLAAAGNAEAAMLEAALACLRRSISARPRRRAALELLAADALITQACEDAVSQGPDVLAERSTTICARLGALLAEAGE